MSRRRIGPTPPRPATLVAPAEDLVVEKMVAGGAGFARRPNGEPLFVRGALPGDGIRLRTVESRKGYSEALAFDILEPSVHRRQSPCRFASRCGGCDLMGLPEEVQRSLKHDLVAEALRRTARLEVNGTQPALEWDTAPGETMNLGYRSRVRLHIDENGRAGFLEGNTHRVVAIDRCLVATEAVNTVLTRIVALSQLRSDLLKPFEQVEIRALGEAADLVWFPRPETTRAGSDWNDVLDALRRHLIAEGLPEPHLVSSTDAPRRWREFVQSVPLRTAEQVAGEVPRLWFAPGTFTQVNWSVNARLIEHLLQLAKTHECTSFLDLFCGAGNFALPLLAEGLQGLGIENNATSISAAQAAAHHQNLGGEFVVDDVTRAVERLRKERRRFDLIVLDPPRAGFKDAAPLLSRLSPRYVFVCACDPVTFARDLKCLTDQGFELRQLRVFDMFPQTHHTETTAWLAAPTR